MPIRVRGSRRLMATGPQRGRVEEKRSNIQIYSTKTSSRFGRRDWGSSCNSSKLLTSPSPPPPTASVKTSNHTERKLSHLYSHSYVPASCHLSMSTGNGNSSNCKPILRHLTRCQVQGPFVIPAALAEDALIIPIDKWKK